MSFSPYTIMHPVQIQWREAASSQMADEKYAHFVVAVSGDRVTALAKAHRLPLQDAADALQAAPGERLFVGRVHLQGLSSGLESLMESLHSLLLSATRPIRNAVGRYQYSGADAITAINVGLGALPAQLRAEGGRVFVRAEAAMRHPNLALVQPS